MSTKWLGGTTCDLCGVKMRTVLYDARTRDGRWGTLCGNCYSNHGTGLGTGKGQKYKYDTLTKSWDKIGG